ncbi:MAG: site-specific DNA-methyltransferase [Candidatus Dojkabacteria bacterium]
MYKLFNNDAIDVLNTLPDNSIDLVVTDPPYRTISGGNRKSDKFKSGYPTSVLHKNDGKIFKYNDIDHEQWLKECYRVLKDNTQIYIMTNTLNLFKLQEIATKVGFKLHTLLVWEKNNCNFSRWYLKNCEYILFMRKGQAKSINNMSTKTVHKHDNILKNKIHPTEKPVGLMELYISNSSQEGETVLDPFMGVGSTGVAALNLNRKFIGIEIDPEYYAKAEERLKGVNQ